jgi:putative hydrolase of the HAD superfamily
MQKGDLTLEFIVFDLDNTLYPRDAGLLQEIGQLIQVWVQREFDISWEDAGSLRKAYLHRYGTTMGGLIAEHDVDVHDYLTFVHDLPVEDYLSPNPALCEMLSHIPLRKVIYTNATSGYGHRVLRALGVDEYFEQVIGVEEVALRNKAYLDAYERMLELLGAAGEACIMVEDWPRNLEPAKALGMTTVLVDPDGEGVADEHIDYVVADVLDVDWVVEELLRR